MKRQRNLRWAHVFIAAIICLMAITPVVRADGPVRVQVDKQDGTDEVEQPVFQPAPAVNSEESRTVGSPEAVPQTGVQGLWAKFRAVGGKFLDGALKWATGSDSQAWSDPQRIWGATKKVGYNLLNGAVEFLTGASIDKWKNVGSWGWKDWLVVGVTVALTFIPIGKAASAGLRVISKAGRPFAARVVGKMTAKAGRGLIARTVNGLAGLVRKGRGATRIGQVLAATVKRPARSRGFKAFVTRTWKPAKQWIKNTGLRKVAGFFKRDPSNPAVDWLLGKVGIKKSIDRVGKRIAKTRVSRYFASTRVGQVLSSAKMRVWGVRDAVVKRNPTGLFFGAIENIAKNAVKKNHGLMRTGVNSRIRKLAYAKREFWANVHTAAVNMRELAAIRTIFKLVRETNDRVTAEAQALRAVATYKLLKFAAQELDKSGGARAPSSEQGRSLPEVPADVRGEESVCRPTNRQFGKPRTGTKTW